MGVHIQQSTKAETRVRRSVVGGGEMAWWWVFGGVCLISVERRSGGLVGWRCVSVMVDGT
jgi:hypothetical protein